MKVCFICFHCVGGFKSFLENTLSLLQKRGFRIDLYCLGQNEVSLRNVNVIRFGGDSKKRRVPIKEKLFLFGGFIGKITKKGYAKLFPHNKCAAREGSLFSSQFSAAKTALMRDTFIDLSEYDCVISSEEVYCNYFLARNVLAKRKICYIHPDYKMAGFSKYFDNFMLKTVDAICTVSLSNAATLKKSLPLLENKIYGVPNPIDVETVLEKSREPLDITFNPNIKNIITVCRLDNVSKALDRLVQVACELKKNGVPFCWRIVGDGPYKETLAKEIRENDVEKEVVLIGYRENPIPFVKKSDLFVLQSYYEGYPISVCESLIVNTPVLITNFPASRELVENGVNGFIVKNNKEDIVGKLTSLLNEDGLLLTMKQNLLNSDMTKFGNTSKLEKIINGTIGQDASLL